MQFVTGLLDPDSDPDPYILDSKFSGPESRKKLLDWTHYNFVSFFSSPFLVWIR